MSRENEIILLLGYALALITELGTLSTKEEKKKIEWFKKAVSCVLYEDLQIPELPE